MESAGGLLEMYSKVPGGIVPGVGPGTGAGTHQASEAINKHARINNTDQEQGQIAETIAELFALPEIEGEAIAAKIPTLSEHLAKGANLAKFLESAAKTARMIRAALNAAKAATH